MHLRELIEGLINDMECNLVVADLLHDNNWNWNALSFNLPFDIKDKINAIPIQLFRRKEDRLIWRLTKDGEFSTASAYMLASKDDGEANSFTRDLVWKLVHCLEFNLSFGCVTIGVSQLGRCLP